MDLRQLRYFLAVAEEGQVTGAARRLNMEQPPLSRQLQLMEQELGAMLFDRSGRRLKLTQAGEVLRRRAEALLLQFQETMEEVRQVDEGIEGALSIGSVVSCISLLPPKIGAFKECYPKITFKISEGDHFLLGEQLDKRQIELVLARLPFEAPSEARYAELRLPPDPFAAILPSGWIAAPADRPIGMDELAQFPLLTLKTNQTTGMHQRVIREFRQYGKEPRILCECSSVAVIIALVAAGIGATILPRSVMASFPLDQIRMYDIAGGDFHSEVGIVWLKDGYLSRSAGRFIEMFRE